MGNKYVAIDAAFDSTQINQNDFVDLGPKHVTIDL